MIFYGISNITCIDQNTAYFGCTFDYDNIYSKGYSLDDNDKTKYYVCILKSKLESKNETKGMIIDTSGYNNTESLKVAVRTEAQTFTSIPSELFKSKFQLDYLHIKGIENFKHLDKSYFIGASKLSVSGILESVLGNFVTNY